MCDVWQVSGFIHQPWPEGEQARLLFKWQKKASSERNIRIGQVEEFTDSANF
jgi:hypothetical protein